MITACADVRPASRAGQRQAIVALVLFSLTLVLVYQAITTSDLPARAVVWAGLPFATYAASLLCFVGAAKGIGPGLASWKFGPWILVWYGIGYGLATTTWRQPQLGTVPLISLSSVLRALWLVAIGMTAWTIGYLIGPGRSIQNKSARLMAAISRRFADEVRSPIAPWILYLVGSGARVVGAVTTGRFGYLGNTATEVTTATGYGEIVSVLALCAPFGVAAAALQVFRERLPVARITLAILFISELVVGAVAGDKVNFLNAALAVCIPYSAARNRLPKAAMAVTIAAFLLIVIPFNVAYRNALHATPTYLTSTQAAGYAPGIFKATITARAIAKAVPISFEYLLSRVQEVDSPAIILQRTPDQIGYLNPVQLIEIPLTGFVPRAIWPNKPIQLPMYKVGEEYYNEPSTAYTAASITPVGDLYRYGGWITVLVGMFFFGCVVKLLDRTLSIRENPQVIFLVLLLFPTVVVAESGWVAIFAGISLILLSWLFSMALTFRWRDSM